MLVSTLGLASCSEDDNTVEEFPDWQNTNESYFSDLKTTTRQLIAAGSSEWKILPTYTQDAANQSSNTDSVIIVQVIEEGEGTVSPLQNDTVRVHYYGQLLPSTTYPAGLVFDKSYSDNTYDPYTSVPYKSVTNAFIDGFITALLNMHVGDHWKVYIPYCLGYGTTSTSSIPAYSTLMFDIRLAGIYKPGTTVPAWK